MDYSPIEKGFLSLTIMDKLFVGETKRLENEFLNIHEEHRKLFSLKEDGFLWNGKFYLPKNQTKMTSSKNTRKVLHPNLWEGFRNYLKDSEKVNTDRTIIRQIIINLLSDANNSQNVRDSLPECLIKYAFDDIKRLERTVPEGSLITNPRHKKQFETYHEDMQFYALTSMVY